MAKTVGLIGFGAIASQIIAGMQETGVQWVVLRRPGSLSPLPHGVQEVTSPEALLEARPVAVVEAAGQGAVAAYLPMILRAGVPVLMASVGALADQSLHLRLQEAAQASGARLILPSGAVAGLDYLRAVADLPGLSVSYTSRKPVAAWSAELHALGQEPGHLQQEYELFSGAAAKAAQLYPQNLNVALTLALTAPKAHLTVRVLADPAATGNGHEISVESPAGQAKFSLINAPSPDNPKTSMLTALSLQSSLKDLLGWLT